MLRRPRIPVFSWGLGLITLVVLLLNIPATHDLDTSLWLFYVVFVGLMLNLGTMFNEGVVSPASTAALMAYLTVGESGSADAALWSVTVGALMGNLGWLLRTLPEQHTRREYARILRSVTVGIAQMTLGLLIGDWVYQAVGGNLPLNQLENSDLLPLIVLVTVYLTVYVGIVFLEAYLMRDITPRQVVRQWQGGVESILLPLPFGVVGAVAYHGLSLLAFIILIVGLLVIVTGVNLLSRTQSRFRRQLRELSALSRDSQAMRANLDL
ncbi:MAG: hypothetical protein K8S97_06250, partial [Anaerolineae bacterium]|nr:hypothetical protein [Anaerolineae bacterium]